MSTHLEHEDIMSCRNDISPTLPLNDSHQQLESPTAVPLPLPDLIRYESSKCQVELGLCSGP